ncbi:hypothetical protein NMG60_11003257 [Bertholletia excelsa]
MNMLEVSVFYHVCFVILLIGTLSSYNYSHPFVYIVSLIYLYLVHERYLIRLRRKVQSEERRSSNQRRVLSDSETVHWLNHAIEKIWLVCAEQIVSQKILLPIIPWFLQKYKPWTVKEAVVQHLYLGRKPPIFTAMRVLRQSTGDDHLVMELGMNFLTADDMNAVLAVKLTKRLGFGMWAKLHLTGMHVEGKVLIGVKFLRGWPFLGRLRLCFVEPPYFQMTVKPLFSHGLDVTELPGIAGWLDKLLGQAFEQTLVEPNMMVVDMEKFVSPQQEKWFSVDEKEPVGYALVEVIEAADLKPADLNGLADPYVKGQLGPYRFRTNTQKKTLAPKWHEEYKVPIIAWEMSNVLAIELCDKDRFVDDALGDCSINIDGLRDGQRHAMWLALQNVKIGRLHLAITIIEGNKKGMDHTHDSEALNENYERNSVAYEISGQSEKSSILIDRLEPIDVQGQQETGIWVHHPGNEVSEKWEPRKGRTRILGMQVNRIESFKPSSGSNGHDSSSADEGQAVHKKRDKVARGLKKIFHSHHEQEDKSRKTEGAMQSALPNLRAVNSKDRSIKLIVEEYNLPMQSPPAKVTKAENTETPEGSDEESPKKRHVKDKAKSFLKHAGKKSAHGFKRVFSHKGSKNTHGDSGPAMPDKDVFMCSDSSDAEVLPSSVYTSKGFPVASQTVYSHGNDSFKSEELNDENTLSDLTIDINDPMNKTNLDVKETIHVPSTYSEENDDTFLKDHKSQVV